MRLAAIRRLHHFIGVFIAPSILFFACSGAFQLFSLHEAHGAYQPPALIVAMARVHKDQVLASEKKADAAERPRPHNAAHHEGGHPDARAKASTLALKAFFLAIDVGLVVSTLLGLWMALIAGREKTIAWLLLLVGAAIPIALLFV
jgi:hypothetical protein